MHSQKLLSLIFLAGMSAGTQAALLTIDGNLNDWGIKKTGNVSDWTPSAALGLIAGTHYTIEDQTGGSGVRLDPGYGGQAYDAEALYVYLTGNTLYIGMATGHNPNTANNPASNSYGAGDFAIDFGRDGSYEVGINIKPSWDSFGVSGGVYQVSQWDYGIWTTGGAYTNPGSSGYNPDKAHPTSIKTGTQLGIVDALAISAGQKGYGQWKNDTHYFYELSLNTQLLKNAGWTGESFDVHWTMNCANDAITADPPGAVPEPATLALLPLGLLGMMQLRRRQR